MHLTNVAIQKHAPGFDSTKVRCGLVPCMRVSPALHAAEPQ